MAELDVVLPVRNGAGYVAAALSSVLKQRDVDFTVIVVDDASCDSSAAEVQRVADDRVRLVAGPGRGVAAALNAGLAAGNSPYVARMDADDVCLPDRLVRQLACLRSTGYELVGGDVRTLSASGRTLPTLHPRLPLDWDECRLHLGLANCFAHPTVMFRRSAIEQVGGYHEDVLFEDYDLWLRLSRRGNRMVNLRGPVLLYRLHPGNTYRSRRGRAADELAPRLAEYCREVLGLNLSDRGARVLLAPAESHGAYDLVARQEAVSHIRALVARASAREPASALAARAHRLAMQIVFPALKDRRLVVPPRRALLSVPRLVWVEAARRLVP